MEQKYEYAFRAWIAFAALMDFGTAIRSYVERRCFVGEFTKSNLNGILEQNDATLPRMLGAFCILKGIVLIYSTIFIHNKPIISMGICTLILSMLIYLTEALFYQSTSFNFHVIFPCILYGLTILGLAYILLEEEPTDDDDENVELAKKATFMKKRKVK